MKHCFHNTFGYPPNSKKGWELKDSDKDSYICKKCKRKKDISVLTLEERVCCEEPLVRDKERCYFIICSWCKEKIYI